LQLAINSFALEAENDFLEAAKLGGTHVEDFNFPVFRLGMMLVHFVQIAGEECRLRLTPGVRKAVGLAITAQERLGHTILGTGHLLLGLLEVGDMRRKIAAMRNREAARILMDGTQIIAAQYRRYLMVRTMMSALTGALVWVFAKVVGLPFAEEWGVIAFALNYIPFIGPFFATLLPTLLAMTTFETWQAVILVFLCLNAIQFIVGSYIEPRVAGNVLSVSPTLVLFVIFFWTFLWGLLGTLLAMPITIAILTFCSLHPRSRWLADLLGSPPKEAPG
jgi:predicted PurR-regulated permease PerM